MEPGHSDSKPVLKIASISRYQFAEDFNDRLSSGGEFFRELHRMIANSLGLNEDRQTVRLGVRELGPGQLTTTSWNLKDMISTFLPRFYALSLPGEGAEYDRWVILEKAIARLCNLVKWLRNNAEVHLNRLVEEAFNMAVHGDEDFGLTVKELREWHEQKYRIPIKRGRKPVKKEKAESVKRIYIEMLQILESDHKVRSYPNAVDNFRKELEIRYSHQADTLVEKIFSKASEGAALYLTGKICNLSPKQVGRYVSGSLASPSRGTKNHS